LIEFLIVLLLAWSARQKDCMYPAQRIHNAELNFQHFEAIAGEQIAGVSHIVAIVVTLNK